MEKQDLQADKHSTNQVKLYWCCGICSQTNLQITFILKKRLYNKDGIKNDNIDVLHLVSRNGGIV